MKVTVYLATVCVLLTGLTTAYAQSDRVPRLINYQGYLGDANTSSLDPLADGVYDVEFRLYDAPTSGTLIWGQKYGVSAVNGNFNVILGAPGGTAVSGTAPLISDVGDAFASPGRYLELTITSTPSGAVGSPQPMTPRQQVLSSPFAIQAQQAELAVGINVFARVEGRKADINLGNDYIAAVYPPGSDSALTVIGADGSGSGGLQVVGMPIRQGASVKVSAVVLQTGFNAATQGPTHDGACGIYIIVTNGPRIGSYLVGFNMHLGDNQWHTYPILGHMSPAELGTDTQDVIIDVRCVFLGNSTGSTADFASQSSLVVEEVL